SGGQLHRNLVEQLPHRVLDPDGNAARNLATRSTEEFPQGLFLLFSLRIPKRVLDRSLRHTMATDMPHQGHGLARLAKVSAKYRRCEVFPNGRPGGFNPFSAVKGILAGNTLCPTITTFAMRSE